MLFLLRHRNPVNRNSLMFFFVLVSYRYVYTKVTELGGGTYVTKKVVWFSKQWICSQVNCARSRYLFNKSRNRNRRATVRSKRMDIIRFPQARRLYKCLPQHSFLITSNLFLTRSRNLERYKNNWRPAEVSVGPLWRPCGLSCATVNITSCADSLNHLFCSVLNQSLLVIDSSTQ